MTGASEEPRTGEPFEVSSVRVSDSVSEESFNAEKEIPITTMAAIMHTMTYFAFKLPWDFFSLPIYVRNQRVLNVFI